MTTHPNTTRKIKKESLKMAFLFYFVQTSMIIFGMFLVLKTKYEYSELNKKHERLKKSALQLTEICRGD